MAALLKLRQAARLIGCRLGGYIAPSLIASSLRHPGAAQVSRHW